GSLLLCGIKNTPLSVHSQNFVISTVYFKGSISMAGGILFVLTGSRSRLIASKLGLLPFYGLM
ncbi:MAG: hypothetical protein CVU90_00795, partial [Firmicutes bacterium HGW-Firmicutes-15]